jgi:hypothetical protein
MEQDLKQYLADNPCKGFRAVPHYFPLGDYLTLYVKEERCYAERVDDLLTVFLSIKTNEMVGFKIKGVRRLLAELGTFGVSVQRDDVQVEAFFVFGKATAKDAIHRLRYEEAAQLGKDTKISRGELLGV